MTHHVKKLLLLLMSMIPTWVSAQSTPACKPTIESECKVGRFNRQCTILSCMGRTIVFVRNEYGKVRTVIIKTPCTGEITLYHNEKDV